MCNIITCNCIYILIQITTDGQCSGINVAAPPSLMQGLFHIPHFYKSAKFLSFFRIKIFECSARARMVCACTFKYDDKLSNMFYYDDKYSIFAGQAVRLHNQQRGHILINKQQLGDEERI